MKTYIACEICDCGDCKTGTNRKGSWFCPVLKKQICDVCCFYDMDAMEYKQVRLKCKSLRCSHSRQ
jgi:hypothetical protein